MIIESRDADRSAIRIRFGPEIRVADQSPRAWTHGIPDQMLWSDKDTVMTRQTAGKASSRN